MKAPVNDAAPHQRVRPDRRAAMQKIFASAAEYDRRVEAEVKTAVKAANRSDAEWIPNDRVEQDWAKRRATLLSRAASNA